VNRKDVKIIQFSSEPDKQKEIMRVFITFAVGEVYEKLSEVLKESIETFSKYPIIIYKPEDFDIKWEPENWQTSYIFIYKVLSCLKSLETYDEVVWLDNDCLPTQNIDKIWNNKVDNYPLLPKERFNNFNIWPNSKPNYRDPNFLGEAKIRIGVNNISFNNLYLQACCMLLNKNCINFFKEVLNHYKDFNSNVYPFGDESIINCMIWRDNLSNNLGDVFLCTHYFSPYIIEAALKSKTPEEYNNLFDINYRIAPLICKWQNINADNEDTLILTHGWSLARHNRLGLIDNNFGNLLFLHGSKSPDLHSFYLKFMKSMTITS
jgi:hypothetical protein